MICKDKLISVFDGTCVDITTRKKFLMQKIKLRKTGILRGCARKYREKSTSFHWESKKGRANPREMCTQIKSYLKQYRQNCLLTLYFYAI